MKSFSFEALTVVSVLPFVTEQHLEKIGITSLGARLQLVNAINQHKLELSLGSKTISIFFTFSNSNANAQNVKKKRITNKKPVQYHYIKQLIPSH